VVVGVGFGDWIAANPAGIKTGGPLDRDMQDIFSLSEQDLLAATFHDPAANMGPNRFHRNRAVSWQRSIPRSESRSSTCLSDNG
jgi:hypothetical protein